MANTEFRTIISVSTGESVQNIKELKENISFLKKSLEGVDLASEEYQKTLKELDVNQRALRDATKTNAKSFTELEQKTNGIGHSYDALRNRLATLTKEWHSVDRALDPKKWDEMAIEINNTRNSLKNMDASVGNFQRNVGDYKNQMVQAFQATAGSASSLIGPIGGVTAGFKALSATPVIAILGILAQVISKVIEGFKSSEENVFALKEAMSAFTPIADAVTNTMQFLAKGIVKVVDSVGKLARKLKLVKGEAVKEREDITRREIALTKRRREAIIQDAKAERDVSELRNKAIQVQYKDRALQKKYLEEAIELEKGILDRKLSIAQEQFEIAKIKAEWTGNDAETNDALAESEANLYRVQKEYADGTRRINSQIATADRSIATEKKKNVDEEENIIRRQIEFGQTTGEMKVEQAQVLADQEIQIDNKRFEKIMENNRKEVEAEREKQEAKKAIMIASVDTLGALFGSLANLMESDEKHSSRNAGRIKALKIAEATIATIQGAIQAYNSAQTLPPPANFIVGGANAGIVTATGIANINKIKSVNIPGGGGEGGSVPSPIISAPQSSMQTSPVIRTITGSRSEDRLNQAIKDQRVILVSSDIDKHNKRVEMVDNEVNF